MNKKILTILLVTGVIFCFLSVVSADNNTTETVEELDLSQYITVSSINGNEITFSDGYAGFSVNPDKACAGSEDGFVAGTTSQLDIANYLKLAVIECYKQNNEGNIGGIIEKFADGSYESSSDEIISSVLDSNDNIADNEVVQISNDTEATFDFEVLEPINDNTSTYFAYKVSLKTVEVENEDNSSDDEVLAVTENDTQQDDAVGNDTDETDNDTNTQNDDKTTTNEKSVEKEDKSTDKSKNTEKEDKTAKNTTKTKNKKTADNKTNPAKENDTKVNVKNKTVINKTNTVIVNEKNTTIINKTTVTHINNTTNATPQNNLMQVAGNPLTILIVVIIIAAIATAVYYKRD